MLQATTSEAATYAVYGGAFLGILIAFTGIAQLLRRGENRSEARSRRMRMIAEGAAAEEILALLKPAPAEGGLSRLPLLSGLPAMLAQAGLIMSPARFLTLSLIAAAVIFLVAAAFLPALTALAAALALGLGLPLLVVKSRRDARIEKLVRQLPDALELMARALKVGHPLNTSIGTVAAEMPDPIGTEFGLIFDQVSFGDDLSDAFQEFADRVAIEDVRYLAASIAIQHGTGGDLARVVSILAKVIRDRLTMRRRIKAVSSEGRLTGIFLSLLPLAIFGFTTITSPDYYGGVRSDPMFLPMLGAILTFTLANFLVLRKLVNFRF
ncbi:type II secretion system F family protein [Sinisalibacter aestuarii]|uniref:Pilus assembly protein TadB n=1 Tax=Sinisalibacter aestuarii TaxID=2949426 RepID=A0ABQ5LV13_9RHOB|nr:type II secretion system F family protein [Sinisalibacter aestuarii]GKY88618.1 pilus assembly protein TadB [Sinisalibacter aestuarii]